MSALGIFAAAQPIYAERGVPTFPVRIDGKDKRPAVRGYDRVGLSGSEQLVLRFGDADGIGFMVRRARITALDIDSPDEGLLTDALARHGDTPIVVRTGGGNHQAWYRHNGEPRRVRPDPTVPVDVLGGGYLVAPPSRGSQRPYELIRGGLDDLERLPTMGNVEALLGRIETAPIELVEQGHRNTVMRDFLLSQAHQVESLQALIAFGRKFANEHFDRTGGHPFTDREIEATAKWAWKLTLDGNNWKGIGRRVSKMHTTVERLAAQDPYANALLDILMMRHWGQDFPLAKARARSLGWTVPRLYSARDRLVAEGLIECVHKGGRGPNDPPRYRWGSGA